MGPRFAAVGSLVDGPGSIWPSAYVVSSPQEGRDFARKVKAAGVDFVKVYWNLGRPEYFAIAHEAKRLGIPIAGHVPLSISPGEASDIGQRSIEHLDGVLVGCSTKEQELLRVKTWSDKWQKEMLDTYDQRKCEKLLARFAQNETWPVPTLVVFNEGKSTSDPRLKYVPASDRPAWRKQIDDQGTPSPERQELDKKE